jgi:uroporphyrinogen-III synthase
MIGNAMRVDQLAGFRIGVTSDRRAGDLIAALERRGAQVLHAPALRIAPQADDEHLIRETRAVITAEPEVVMISTGYGMQRWFEVADAAGLGAQLTAVLDRAVIMARGPKAVGAVRAAGLEDARASEHVTTASMVDELIETRRTGSPVAIQLHGYTDEVQLERLRRVSSQVLTVAPYRWVRPAGADRLPRLIDAVCERQLDAVTFASAPGAAATLETATALGRLPDFLEALTTDVVPAAVGPLTAAPLREVGLTPVVPDRYRLGALTRLVCDTLCAHRVQRFRSTAVAADEHEPVEIEIRGRAVTIGERPVVLGPNALALFKTLAATTRVVTRAELQRSLPGHADEHALEVAMSRLRRSLGVPGLISTVVKRGYRLNATRSTTPLS